MQCTSMHASVPRDLRSVTAVLHADMQAVTAGPARATASHATSGRSDRSRESKCACAAVDGKIMLAQLRHQLCSMKRASLEFEDVVGRLEQDLQSTKRWRDHILTELARVTREIDAHAARVDTHSPERATADEFVSSSASQSKVRGTSAVLPVHVCCDTCTTLMAEPANLGTASIKRHLR